MNQPISRWAGNAMEVQFTDILGNLRYEIDRSHDKLSINLAEKVHSLKLAPWVTQFYCSDTADLHFLTSLVQLTKLTLTFIELPLPSGFTKLTRLNALSIQYVAWIDFPEDKPLLQQTAQMLQAMTHLRELNLQSTQLLVDEIDWSCMGHIQTLNIDASVHLQLNQLTMVSDLTIRHVEKLAHPVALRKLTQLTKLQLDGIRLWPVRVESLTQLESLVLNLSSQEQELLQRNCLSTAFRMAQRGVSLYVRGLHSLQMPSYVVANILSFVPECQYFDYEELVQFVQRNSEFIRRLRSNRRQLPVTAANVKRVLRGEPIYK